NPAARVQVRGSTVPVEATEANAVEREDLWRRLVQMYPYFADYETRTTRQIPVIVLTPTAT
ncbi:MAG: nitroreductase family deazaflavin-dependent oxidoreductase, partial [Mycolicibacterium aromaticivorans]|nr:nitroreductase family deazaflavin-dependent oxidoreductase [Mycolicibacterium aromaticivorans]